MDDLSGLGNDPWLLFYYAALALKAPNEPSNQDKIRDLSWSLHTGKFAHIPESLPEQFSAEKVGHVQEVFGAMRFFSNVFDSIGDQRPHINDVLRQFHALRESLDLFLCERLPEDAEQRANDLRKILFAACKHITATNHARRSSRIRFAA